MRKITWKIVPICLYFYYPLQRIHQFLILKSKNINNVKVFCIGSPKTGTTSLHKALKILGYKSIRLFEYSSYWKKGKEEYLKKVKNSRYEAFVDHPFGRNNLYKKIDKSISNCKFILTVRDNKALKKSWINFYKNSPIDERTFKYIPDERKLIEKRNNEIIQYFEKDPSKLLVINIFEGEGWEELCTFLKKPMPKKPFPHKNKGKYSE